MPAARRVKRAAAERCADASTKLVAIGLSLLPQRVSLDGPAVESAPGAGLKERVDAYERGLIVAALEQTGGNRTHTARALALNRGTLHSKLQKFGLARADEGDEQGSPESQ